MGLEMSARKGREAESVARRPRRRLIAPLLLAGAVLLSASPAIAYFAGQQIWSQTKTVNAGTTRLSDFTVSDNRPYDMYGKVTTTCTNTAQKWGYRLVETKNWLPDTTIVKKNWDSPIKTCTEQVVRATLSAGATGYHYDAKVSVSGASFAARVVAR